GAGHGPGGAVFRRADFGARPADVARDRRRHRPVVRRQRDHVVRDARRGSGARDRRQRGVPRRRGGARRGRRRRVVRPARRPAHPRLLLTRAAQLMGDWSFFIAEVLDYWPQILDGLGSTLLLAAVITVTGLLWGVVVFYLSLSERRVVRRLTNAYISFFIGTPLIVLLF